MMGLRAEALSVRLGGRQVLHEITLEARAGEVTAIVGPNGSGKTTLLRALAGELATGGTVRLNGRDIRKFRPAEVATLRAVLPQATTLAFPFTVREVVHLGVAAGVAPGNVTDLPELALARVGLSGFGGRLYPDLSGGEQQRVQLARVLCQIWAPVVGGEPRWLLLDEPVSSLDIRHQLLVMEVAAQFARAGGGVVAVLHDLNLAAVFADRMIIMQDGRIAGQGSPEEVMVDALLTDVFGCGIAVSAVPLPGTPFVLPHTAVQHTAHRGIA